MLMFCLLFFFFFNDPATTEIYTGWYTLSLHDALPISTRPPRATRWPTRRRWTSSSRSEEHTSELQSHHPISYAVFCLKKKKKKKGNKSNKITSVRQKKRKKKQT